MRHKTWHKAFLVALGLSLAAGSARAEFVRNGRGWERLSPSTQQGYIAGVIDQTGVAGASNDRQLVIRSAAELCLGHNRTTLRALAAGVTEAYRSEPKLWGKPPFLIAWYVAARRCKAEIDTELTRGGLEPLDVDAMLTALKVDLARAR